MLLYSVLTIWDLLASLCSLNRKELLVLAPETQNQLASEDFETQFEPPIPETQQDTDDSRYIKWLSGAAASPIFFSKCKPSRFYSVIFNNVEDLENHTSIRKITMQLTLLISRCYQTLLYPTVKVRVPTTFLGSEICQTLYRICI